MDPFRYHDLNEQVVNRTPKYSPNIMHSKSPPILSVPLVLPNTPGESFKLNGRTTGHHSVETSAHCTGPGVHIITSLVQSRLPLNSMDRSNVGGSSGGQMSCSAPSSDGFSLWENIKEHRIVNACLEKSSSLASSPPNSIPDKPLSLSSSPPTSVYEIGFRRRTYSRCSSVSGQIFSNNGIKPCSLCKKNGERPKVFNGHQLHTITDDGRRIVTCPVLYRVRCQICGASGDDAHTLTHCPYSPNRVPVALMVKNTARQGDGSFRKRLV